MSEDLRSFARRWMDEDPDPVTREQTARMLHDVEGLRACFGSRLQFGTAGLRGPLGPGPAGMNRAMVRRVTAGLGRYVRDRAPGGSVVVGYDGRHNSRVFAEDAAAVLAGLELEVYLFDEICPTPTLAHAVTFLRADAGVMITASHNPPGDNGYKVYWSNGAQIVPPHDQGISDAIDGVRTLYEVSVPRLEAVQQSGQVMPIPDSVQEDYLRRVLALRVHPDEARQARLKVVYTAMHGVGTASVQRTMGAAGYKPILVPEQAEPDPDFPTVAFPNPEEPGALDLATKLAKRVRADIIVANDPDADRLAVVVPDGKGWRQLTGNEVGCLLAEDLLTHGAPTTRSRMVATTIVSSTMLEAIARAHGVVHKTTLTGFKWIANAAIPFDADGGKFVIGYEEALGYSVGDVVRDKDGVSAILLFCDLAAYWKNNGKTVMDALRDLSSKYGVFASKQLSVKLPGEDGQAEIGRIMDNLRLDRIDTIGGIPVLKMTDVLRGETLDLQDGSTTPVDLPVSNVLAWHLNDGSRVLARPSGTEPKIKYYFEVVERLYPSEALAQAEQRAAERIGSLEQGMRTLIRA